MRIVAILALLALAACQASGPAESRWGYRFQWLDYLTGQDLRATCLPNSADRLRLVYNADFNVETRTFDLTFRPGGAADLETRRWLTSSLLVLQGGTLNNALEPQRGRAAVDAAALDALIDAVAASGFPGPLPVGRKLRSDAFFWVALACVDGRFGYQVWSGERLREVRFAGLLEQLDPIGAPLPPASLEPLPPLGSVIAGQRRNNDGTKLYYEAEVAADGLRAWWRQ